MTFFATLLVLVAATGSPKWSKAEVKSFFGEAAMAAQSQSVQEQDTRLARTAAMAYEQPFDPRESPDVFARRVVKKLDPTHPTVKSGTWLSVLTARLYRDLGARAKILARFERDRRDRAFFEARSGEALSVATQIEKTIRIKVEGLEGYVAPLPRGPGRAPTTFGAVAHVHDQQISVGSLDRQTFENDRPKLNAIRTPGGALRELVAAQKQSNIHNQMFARVDANKKKSVGLVRVYIPAVKPAIYLNELVRAAREAENHTLFVMTLGPKSGALKEIEVSLTDKKPDRRRRRKKRVKYAKVQCKDDESMQKCVDRMTYHLEQGSQIRYVAE